MRSVQEIIGESLQAKSDLLSDTELLAKVEDAAGVMIDSYQQGGKVLFCGNGGSAADAQHFAAELSGRFLFDRPPAGGRGAARQHLVPDRGGERLRLRVGVRTRSPGQRSSRRCAGGPEHVGQLGATSSRPPRPPGTST